MILLYNVACGNGFPLGIPSESGGGGASTAADVSYDNTSSGLTADDVQAAIDELAGDISAPAAEDVSYDNTDSGLTADDVQDAIDELAGDISTLAAANVSYDNTDSGLTADDVQDAIDELAGDIGDNYSNSETVIGTWLGRTLYRKVIDTGVLPNATTKEVVTGLTNVSIKRIYGVASRSDVQMSLPSVNTDPAFNVSLTANGSGSSVWLASAGDRSSFTASYVVLEYTKS